MAERKDDTADHEVRFKGEVNLVEGPLAERMDDSVEIIDVKQRCCISMRDPKRNRISRSESCV
jgi:hypothetical protein